ncbi:MAG: proton-conducting transporter membrane subunit [Enterobacteriaceae bacterium]
MEYVLFFISIFILLILSIIFFRNNFFIFIVTLLSIFVSIIFNFFKNNRKNYINFSLFNLDKFSNNVILLILIFGLFSTLIFHSLKEPFEIKKEEYYLMIISNIIGDITILCSSNMIGLFIGIEIVSISLLGMITYSYNQEFYLETCIKYLVYSSIFSVLFLLSSFLIYINSKSFYFDKIFNITNYFNKTESFKLGLILLFTFFIFKFSLFPFIFWNSLIYKGSSNISLFFFSTINKISMFSVFIKLFYFSKILFIKNINYLIFLISLLSMFLSNFLNLKQKNLRNIFSYSSVYYFSQLILIIGIKEIDKSKLISLVFIYFLNYLLSNLIINTNFCILNNYEHADTFIFNDYRRISKVNKIQLFSIIVAIMSLVGFPMTIGFLSKIYTFLFMFKYDYNKIITLIIINSILSYLYYFKLLIYLFANKYSLRKYICNKKCDFVLMFISIIILIIGSFPNLLKIYV